MVHKKLLCLAASFFDKAFNGEFKEGKDNTMDMPEDHAGAFGLFVSWSVFLSAHDQLPSD